MRIHRIILPEDSDSPLYLKLADALRRSILLKEVTPGERLPSIRRLSDTLNVNPATVAAAYRILEREGWVTARAGSGVYVMDRPVDAGGNLDPAVEALGASTLMDLERGRIPPQGINMAAGTPSPRLFPVTEFRSLMDEVLERDGGWAFGYQESTGWAPFREALREYAESALGIRVSIDDIQVISGAQQGIDLSAKALLRSGDPVIVERPTYRGALSVFWSRGSDTVSVELTPQGMDLGVLERRVQAQVPRLVYIISRYQNPTTYSWSAEALEKLLYLAEKYNFYILEDDLLSDLYYGKAPEPSCLKAMDRQGRVIYIRSFSKVLMPGLRLGMLLVPPPLRGAYEAAKRSTDIATDGFIQRAVELYLRRSYHIPRLQFLRAHYGALYRSIIQEIDTRLVPLGLHYLPPEGGLHLWLSLPDHLTGSQVHSAALAAGLALIPEAVYGNAEISSGEKRADNHIRLSIAALEKDEGPRAIEILEDVIRTRRV
jgi:DNA-binding transcriptional MocR family regulator